MPVAGNLHQFSGDYSLTDWDSHCCAGEVSYRLRTPGATTVDNEKSLKQELAALRHELRRVSDGLERNRTRELEQQAERLRANIALCERELQQLQSSSDRT